MRLAIFFLTVAFSSICLAQSDSMFVERMDGSIRGYPIALINQISFSSAPTSVREKEVVQNAISSFALYQNYPNPFNPNTTIQYNLPQAGSVEVNIFDVQGRLVRSLFKSNQLSGTHSIAWDSRSSGGSQVASGTYFCQVLFDGSAIVKKLLLVK